MKNPTLLSVTFVVVFLITATTAVADVPQMINYQGRLADNQGVPVVDGSYDITFTIWNDETASDPVANKVWSSGVRSVTVAGGLLMYQLGSAVLLPDDLFETDTLRWLGIQIGADPEISPRTKLNSVPYAYQALRSDTASYVSVGWVDDGPVVHLETDDDDVGIGTAAPNAHLEVYGSNKFNPLLKISNIEPIESVYDPAIEYFWAAYGISPLVITGAGVIEQYIDNSGVPKNVIGLAHSYFNAGNVGIGTASPAAGLHVENLSLASAEAAVKVDFGASTADIATQGVTVESATLTVKGSQVAVSGVSSVDRGVYGQGTATGCLGQSATWAAYDQFIGVYGKSDASVITNMGSSTSNSLGGTFIAEPASAMTLDATGTYYVGGIYGEVSGEINADANGIIGGVIGVDNSTGTGTSFAGYFEGNVYATGDVGVGTNQPARKLHVSDVMRLEPRTSAPPDPSAGDMYFDGSTNKLRVYDGSLWRDCW